MKLKITSKLLLTILLTNVVIITVLALYLRNTFKSGLSEYLNQVEVSQLNPLVQALSSWYENGGQLDSLQYDRRQWHNMLLQSLPGVYRDIPPDGRLHHESPLPPVAGIPQDNPGSGRRHLPGYPHRPGMPAMGKPDRDKMRRDHRRPPPVPTGLSDPSGLVPRIRLLDADKQLLLGQGYPGKDHSWLPIKSDQQRIGWLTLAPSMIPVEGLAAQFKTHQDRALALTGIIAILVSALAVFALTRNLLSPIRRLAVAAHQLAGGAFATRVEVTSTDELGQLAGDFNALAHALEENEHARRQWIADISHELRTPLAILRGEIEAIQDGVREPGAQQLRSLHTEVLSLGKLVDDLYELSLSDVGAFSCQKESINLANLLEEVVAGFQQRYQDADMSLYFDARQLPQVIVFADAGRLAQLFNNLLENSLRYTDAGGETKLFMELQNNSVFVHLQDSLPGVPKASLPRLFDRLYRVDESRSRANGGAGLGLSICKSIVDAHEGQIRASTSPAGGLWISIELPVIS